MSAAMKTAATKKKLTAREVERLEKMPVYFVAHLSPTIVEVLDEMAGSRGQTRSETLADGVRALWTEATK